MSDTGYQKTGTVVSFPYKDTPMWEYLKGYYVKYRTNKYDALQYLIHEVPESLRKQVHKHILAIEESKVG